MHAFFSRTQHRHRHHHRQHAEQVAGPSATQISGLTRGQSVSQPDLLSTSATPAVPHIHRQHQHSGQREHDQVCVYVSVV